MKNILYIEDDPILQRAVKRALERDDDVVVTIAGDAPTAIKILEAADRMFGCFHYEHILCDFDLYGGTTGAEVFAWIQQRSNLHATANDSGHFKTPRQVYLERFTFLTSRRDEALALHNRFVEKPCTTETIRKAIQTKGPLVLESAL